MNKGTSRFIANEDGMKSTITLPRARAFFATVAFFERDCAKLLPLKKGDSMVVDMSLTSVPKA